MNIIIPMALGEEHISLGEYQYPKPLIDMHGKPLVEYVIDNLLSIKGVDKLYFILNQAACDKYHIDNTISLLAPNAEMIYLKKGTTGSVCSILMAIDEVNKEEECIVVNADQIFLNDLNTILTNFRNNKLDAGVITFNSVHPRWSYILAENGSAVQFAEKKPISKNAIAGFYYFKTFQSFIEGAFRTLLDDDQLNGRFYVSAVLNQLILAGKKVSHQEIKSEDYLSFYSDQKIKEFDNFLNTHKHLKL